MPKRHNSHSLTTYLLQIATIAAVASASTTPRNESSEIRSSCYVYGDIKLLLDGDNKLMDQLEEVANFCTDGRTVCAKGPFFELIPFCLDSKKQARAFIHGIAGLPIGPYMDCIIDEGNNVCAGGTPPKKPMSAGEIILIVLASLGTLACCVRGACSVVSSDVCMRRTAATVPSHSTLVDTSTAAPSLATESEGSRTALLSPITPSMAATGTYGATAPRRDGASVGAQQLVRHAAFDRLFRQGMNALRAQQRPAAPTETDAIELAPMTHTATGTGPQASK